MAGKVVTLASVGLFADGAAVRTVGRETFRLCNVLVDGMITVKTDEICAAIKMCFNDTRCVLEPAGALGIAGMVKFIRSTGARGKTMVAITSGANMDFDRLRFVSERADSSETLMAVTIPERPGSLREFYTCIYPRNVTEFSYRWSHPSGAHFFVSLQSLRGHSKDDDTVEVLQKLQSKGYVVHDYSDNELAKAHIRHLAGGRLGRDFQSNSNSASGSQFTHEHIYRFEFPEAPGTFILNRRVSCDDNETMVMMMHCCFNKGALGKFLFTLTEYNGDWSISLFHYRNHGHDYGRVLVGLLVKEDSEREKQRLHSFLDKLAYKYYEETSNSAFLQFLQ